MTSIEKDESKVEKGISTEECLAKAKKYISENGICLFLFDVQDSAKFEDRQALQTQLFDLINELNLNFDKNFPENNLATQSRQEKGFSNLLGDGSWVAINDFKVILMIVEYIQNNYPNISFYYDVAKDGYDDVMNLLK
jgi:hypothetical protein